MIDGAVQQHTFRWYAGFIANTQHTVEISRGEKIILGLFTFALDQITGQHTPTEMSSTARSGHAPIFGIATFHNTITARMAQITMPTCSSR